MASFLSQNPGYIDDDVRPPFFSTFPRTIMLTFLISVRFFLKNATDECAYCVYSKGSDYLATLNLSKHIYGWRDICLTFLFVLSSCESSLFRPFLLFLDYRSPSPSIRSTDGLVFLLMKLRSKKTKAAVRSFSSLFSRRVRLTVASFPLLRFSPHTELEISHPSATSP